jgi:hypothetical protein
MEALKIKKGLLKFFKKVFLETEWSIKLVKERIANPCETVMESGNVRINRWKDKADTFSR